MRVTQNMLTRNYMSRVNLNATNYDKSFTKLGTGRAFSKMHENVTGGTRALQIRSNLYRNRQYQDNTAITQQAFAIAENNLTEVKDLMVDGHALALRIENGTFEQTERAIIATQFKSQMEQILKTGNAIFGDNYVFSGTKSDDVPFTKGEYSAINSEPYYNNAKITDINKVVNFAEYFDVSKIYGLKDLFPDDLRNKTTYVGTWNDDGTVFAFKTDSGRTMTLEGNLDDGYDLYDSLSDLTGTREIVELDSYTNFIKKVPLSTGFAFQSDPGSFTYYDQDLRSNVTHKLLDEDGFEWTRDGDGLYRTSEMVVEYDSDGVCTNYEGLTDAQIRNQTVYYDGEHGNIWGPTGFYQTADNGLMQGNYIRDNKNGFFYEVNRDDGGKTYTNEYGDRIAVSADAPRYAVTKVQYSDDNYVDIGLGLKVSELFGLDNNSVIKSTVSGLDAYGFGSTNVKYSLPESVKNIPEDQRSFYRQIFDANGDGSISYEIPNSAYGLFETMAKALDRAVIPDSLRSAYMTMAPQGGQDQRELIQKVLQEEIDSEQLSKDKIYTSTFINDEGDEITTSYSTFDMYQAIKIYNDVQLAVADTHLVKQTDKVIRQIADIGIRDKYLETNLERLENEELTLQDLQQKVEGINDAEEITKLEMNEYAWTLTLKFGSRFLPQSLMDYIR
ncbi:hypothetical protein FACS1894132_04270 [Clostridia bacterium]|nr:hypothetical protein FACS1894132_04270 [Clostridia bacterium]